MSAPIRRKLRGFIQQRAPFMITCRELEEFIADYLDDTLPRRQRIVFRVHLALCRECRDYLASYEHAIALGIAVFQHPDEAVPEEIPEDLVRAILTARGGAKD